MQAYAVLIVTQHLEDLRADAARQRRFATERPSLRRRFANVVDAVRGAVRPTDRPVSAASTH